MPTQTQLLVMQMMKNFGSEGVNYLRWLHKIQIGPPDLRPYIYQMYGQFPDLTPMHNMNDLPQEVRDRVLNEIGRRNLEREAEYRRAAQEDDGRRLKDSRG
jgi:hypothetical protein